MSKIVQAVNAMIENPDKIREVMAFDPEYFFVYDFKYQWSITFTGEEYLLFYYPNKVTFQMGLLSPQNPRTEAYQNLLTGESLKHVTYRTSELKSREVYETFQDLYILLQEKSLGVDRLSKTIS